MEQRGYNLIRTRLSGTFLEDPVKFVEKYGARPEDMSGSQMRDAYRALLVVGFQVHTADSVFNQIFNEGRLFA